MYYISRFNHIDLQRPKITNGYSLRKHS